MAYFADVILPLSLPRLYTYEVREAEAAFLKPGMRVAVPFGKSKIYTALVWRIHSERPLAYEPKEIDQILDETPVASGLSLTFMEWVASYYLCTLGEVYRNALPSALLLESETLLQAAPDYQVEANEFTDDEVLVWEALQRQQFLKIREVEALLERKSALPVIRQMLEKGMIQVSESLKETYKPKWMRFVRLTSAMEGEEALQSALTDLDKAPKQKEVLMQFYMLQAASPKPIAAKKLLKQSGASAAILKALEDKGVLESYYLAEDRTRLQGTESREVLSLSEAQQQSLETIQEGFAKKQTVLFHGVTSSGKTEIYARLIREALDKGKQVLYLVPEIGFTTQLIQRLKLYFGEQMAVYHSRYSQNERVEVWYKVLRGESGASLVVATRSGVFLPFENLGLIVVDEEHDISYKQQDPSPRFHGRDAAVYLGYIHKSAVLLGSATPSLESYHNAEEGKYLLVTLKERFGKVLMPDMELTDLKEQYRKKRMKGHFSERLREEIAEALAEGNQVILFQNRRGFAPVVQCSTCGHVAECPNCDVSLTLHKHQRQLRCHYCGYSIAQQQQCAACGSRELLSQGFGTEQIEQELHELFPEARTGRMDADTTRGKYGFERIITSFSQAEIDILVGTQMITKGLNFKRVSLVGIMQADSMLQFPDFRAQERTFQMIQQVAGRAGRFEKRGKVIVQTFNPHHQILQQASVNRYEAMYRDQMEERRHYHYPPFYKIIRIHCKARELPLLQEGAGWLATTLKMHLGNGAEVLGPEFPQVARVRNEYQLQILIKIAPGVSLSRIKERIKKIDNSFHAIANFKKIRRFFDVDAY